MSEFLDITSEKCPMTFVKVKLKLESLNPGDTLEVLLNEGEPLENVPKSVEEIGHRVLKIKAEGAGKHKVVIEKKQY